jgi:hypothetical protein
VKWDLTGALWLLATPHGLAVLVFVAAALVVREVRRR